MNVYLNGTIDELPNERELIEQLATLGEDVEHRPHSWTGICNARLELRVIVESFTAGQSARIADMLRRTRLLGELPEQTQPDDVFLQNVVLDRLFSVAH